MGMTVELKLLRDYFETQDLKLSTLDYSKHQKQLPQQRLMRMST
jgi:hypothetical protein